ncbi:tRNA-queuosine alpha-mannosyltransferase domain-containing protein [Desulfogranum mediterraneum]|uniref:tRNA-queuosine alpha-mannosyltransferase domain-containing protein n=1 Tax=Desulfogranum mediterraneum TaxID=160661 RepID=UPI000A079D09|nr:DUF3524 domain-containing protein [Desulfogranum mediterraneum]
MQQKSPHYLIVEPYYGGSHKSFLTGLERHLEAECTLLTLPARKWKMRMQLAAPWMAERIMALVAAGHSYDLVLCSTFIDLAVLRALLARAGIALPLAIYFHENQFAYPSRGQDQTRHQFTAINFTSALCADGLAFNSHYNRDSFLAGISRYLKKAADISLAQVSEELEAKSVVLYPGMDYGGIDRTAAGAPAKRGPVVVWNHRWEHDKNPEPFFSTLAELSREGLGFELIVAGQSFRDQPEVFARARQELAGHIRHFGYLPAEEDYWSLLQQGTIVVSTAIHEFFGMAVLEAVRAGCRPLVPDRLAYRELFPDEYRYKREGFKRELRALLESPGKLKPERSRALTEPYSWPQLSPGYAQWLRKVARSSVAAITPMAAKKMRLSS